MERQRPDTSSNALDLYVRTYYSLLRSSGEVRVRSFEEAHLFSDSSLHEGGRDERVDIGAFGYAAGRMPECLPDVENILLGQSEEVFRAGGYDVRSWKRTYARGRRRPYRYDGERRLAAFIASASDIDDIVPIVTAYQIEWNKMHAFLDGSSVLDALEDDGTPLSDVQTGLSAALQIDEHAVERLIEAFGPSYRTAIAKVGRRRLDLRVRLLAGSFSDYQRAAQRWWRSLEPVYLEGRQPAEVEPAPVYFVSSNTHALVNVVGGYAAAHRDVLMESARAENPGEVWSELQNADSMHPDQVNNLLYFALRHYVRQSESRRSDVQAWDAACGISTVPDPGHVEVAAQVFRLADLVPDRVDPRLRLDGLEELAGSDAKIINIDYPLGMAAYQLLSRVGQGIGELLGMYVMGKAATLNGRVGDVMISKVVQDEHSRNTFIIRNAFGAEDVAPYLQFGSVLDNQKALTVRSAFLQNRNYMGVFYREGYTVLEMEAGPYLSASYELLDPRRHPNDEIVYLGERAKFDIGILHYASDTPYSRRQSLLSKSMGYFGVDATYACAVAIARSIFANELERLRARSR
ncbi:MAG: hypothetical protein AAF605_08285 [Myxococcota bacterium]